MVENASARTRVEGGDVADAIKNLGRAIDAMARAVNELSARLGDGKNHLVGDSPVAAKPQELPRAPGTPLHQAVPQRSPRVGSRVSNHGPHGGPRRASVSKGVDDLIKAGWVVRRSQDELVAKLQERYPGANSDNVLHVLKRRINKSLVRTKVDGSWVWSVIET